MKKIVKILIILFVCFNFVDLQAPYDDDFPACSRRDPQLPKCLMNLIETLRPRFKTGMLSKVFVVSPLDPFTLSNFEVGDARFLKVTLYDLHIIGATNFNLQDIGATYSESEHLMEIMPHVQIDRIDIKTKYSLNGFLPLPQTGEASFSLLDLKIHGHAKVRLFQRNGKEYAKVEQAKLMFESIKIGNLRYALPIGKTRDAGPFLNFFLKYFGESIMKTLYRVLERRIDQVHVDLVNDFIKNVPATYFIRE